VSGGGPGGVIRGLVGLVRSEIRLARLATRAPALFASVRRAAPQTYDETSKWPLLFIIALVSFVPDTVLFALIPVSLWIHVLLIFVSVYSTVWIAGVYSSTVAMPHVIGPAEVRFYNGVFSEVDASRIKVTGARMLSTAERRIALREEPNARAMFCPGVAFVRIDFDGSAELRPMVGRPREVREHLFVPSDQPQQLARALLQLRQNAPA